MPKPGELGKVIKIISTMELNLAFLKRGNILVSFIEVHILFL